MVQAMSLFNQLLQHSRVQHELGYVIGRAERSVLEVASSGAQRLRPEGIHTKAEIEPANWFLNERADVRSSYYLEDVASEFDIQGLELDWVGVCWDGEFYHDQRQWVHRAFKGTQWQSVNEC